MQSGTILSGGLEITSLKSKKLHTEQITLILLVIGVLLRLVMTVILFGDLGLAQIGSDSAYYLEIARQPERLGLQTNTWGYHVTGIAPLYPLFRNCPMPRGNDSSKR